MAFCIAPNNHPSKVASPLGQLKVKISESPDPLSTTLSKVHPPKVSVKSSSTPV